MTLSRNYLSALLVAMAAASTSADAFAALKAPVADTYTDFTGVSFTAHWQPVDGATGYYLTVGEYDDDKRALIQPYFLADAYTTATEYVVEGITPGAKYQYYVCATDGTSTSAKSNIINVYKLATPSGLVIDETDGGFRLSWDAVGGATEYTATVRTHYTAPADETYAIASADFSDFDGKGSVAQPFVDDDNQLATYPQLPGWEFTLNATAGHAVGVEYDADLAKYGFGAKLRSPDYVLDDTSTGYLNITLNMASTYGNDVQVTYYTELPSGLKKEISDTFTTTSEFSEYKTALPTGKTPGYLTIAPVPNSDNKGNVFINSLLIRVKFPQGGVMELPHASIDTRDTEATFTAPYVNDTYYMVNVTAYQRVPYLNLGYITRLSSDPSETLEFRPSSGVNTIGAEPTDTSAEYYNLQGIRVANPIPGQLYIRRQGTSTTKIIAR